MSVLSPTFAGCPQEMVCVEVAQAGSGPVTLQPGETWRAGQTLQLAQLD